MILRFLALFFVLFTLNLSAQEAWPDKTRVLPAALRKIPVALYISHGPNPNYPEINDTGRYPEMKYVWKHETTVCSPEKKLTIVKAGSYIWYNESGWQENVQYNKKDFKKKFECPQGVLDSGACYTFKENYRWGSNLYGGDALWYVLAEDEEGNLYKGIGLIETESELLKN